MNARVKAQFEKAELQDRLVAALRDFDHEEARKLEIQLRRYGRVEAATYRVQPVPHGWELALTV